MLKVLGLSTASQGVVFGVAIILGMLISGDRISDIVGRLLLRPRDSHALRLLGASLELSPRGETRWMYDALGNVLTPDQLLRDTAPRRGEPGLHELSASELVAS